MYICIILIILNDIYTVVTLLMLQKICKEENN